MSINQSLCRCNSEHVELVSGLVDWLIFIPYLKHEADVKLSGFVDVYTISQTCYKRGKEREGMLVIRMPCR